MADWYASPSGSSSNDGSEASPWSLSYALKSSSGGSHPIAAGDTLYLLEGTYTVTGGPLTCWLTGTSLNRITVRPAEGLDRNAVKVVRTDANNDDYGVFAIRGSYLDFVELEISISDTDRSVLYTGIAGPWRGSGMSVFGDFCRVMRCFFHDCGIGLAIWGDGYEVSDNVFWGNGNNKFDHAVYTHSENGIATTTRVIRNNLCLASGGNGIQLNANSSPDSIENFLVEDNACACNGDISASSEQSQQLVMTPEWAGCPVEDVTIQRNWGYARPTGSSLKDRGFRIGSLGEDSPGDVSVSDNVSYARTAYEVNRVNELAFSDNLAYSSQDCLSVRQDTSPYDFSLWTLSGNDYRDTTPTSSTAFRHNGSLKTFANWKLDSGLDASSAYSTTISGTLSRCVASLHDASRGHIAVYNFDGLTEVDVDVSSVLSPGDSYELYDGFNFSGAAVASGTCLGTTIPVPMDLATVQTPVGTILGSAVHPNPYFGAYVLFKTSAESTPETFPAAVGVFSLLGQDASLKVARTLAAGTGEYSLSGQDALAFAGKVLSAAAGTYTLSGQDVEFLAGNVLSASSGSFQLSGQSASFLRGLILSAQSGSFSLSGQDSDVLMGIVLDASSGSFSLSGGAASFRADRFLEAQAGSFFLQGQEITLPTTAVLAPETNEVGGGLARNGLGLFALGVAPSVSPYAAIGARLGSLAFSATAEFVPNYTAVIGASLGSLSLTAQSTFSFEGGLVWEWDVRLLPDTGLEARLRASVDGTVRLLPSTTMKARLRPR